MATNVRIELDHAGFTALLCGGEVAGFVNQTAQQVASRAGEGFEVNSYIGGYGGGRAVATIHAKTPEARLAEAEHKALSKAVGA